MRFCFSPPVLQALLLACAYLSAFGHMQPPAENRPAPTLSPDGGVTIDQNLVTRFREIRSFVYCLAAAPVNLFSGAEQRQLEDAADWAHAIGTADQPFSLQVQSDRFAAERHISELFDNSASVVRVWAQSSGTSAQRTIERHWTGDGALMLRVGRNDCPKNGGVCYLRSDTDLSKNSEKSLEIGNADPAYAVLFFTNVPSGALTVPIRILSSGTEVARVVLALDNAQPTGTVNVKLVDAETKKPAMAAVAFFAADDRIIAPDDALSFDEAGPPHYLPNKMKLPPGRPAWQPGDPWYQPGHLRRMSMARYWPGNSRQQKAFFVDGGFSLRVPEGIYTLMVAKGMEYLPVTETVEVKAGETVGREVMLKRWVDMPARGWYSGDGHVHYPRMNEAANRTLMFWARASDVHMVNVLSMGDSEENYFEQFAYGKEGRFVSGDYAIVPGQEDPRTLYLGHTIQWNLQKLIRFPDRYYLYDAVIDETRRQGGLAGHSHVGINGCHVVRDLTLSVPTNRSDFAEICQDKLIGTKIYYDFLNLGYPMTVSAASDVPFGGTIGDSSVYVYTGGAFTPDAWLNGVKAGHTFVTTGPMLELKINDAIPGTQIAAHRGDVLHVKASATGDPVPPNYLEIVAKGEVIKAVQASLPNQKCLSLDFTIPVTDSTWIAGRCAGGHTTPVYVKVDGRRFWRLDQVASIVALRLKDLDDVEHLADKPLISFPPGNVENTEVAKRCAAALHERIMAARAVYEGLLRDSRRELDEQKTK